MAILPTTQAFDYTHSEPAADAPPLTGRRFFFQRHSRGRKTAAGLVPFGPRNTSQPLVTIGVPAYNRPALLRECLASLAAQTEFDDFDVVVCDDLGLPETRHVVENSRLPRIRLHVNPQPLGAVGNWNRCLELSTGTWVMILHEDDTLYPWYFSTVVPRLRSGVSAVTMKCVQGQDPVPPPAPGRPGKIRFYPSSCFIKSAMTPFPGVLFLREIAVQLGGFNARWGPLADYDFWYRLACSGSVETLGSVGAFYRENDGQWTCSVWPEMLRKNHLLRLRVAREQFRRHPRLGRWLARFFTYRNARCYRRRFSERPADLARALKFGGRLERLLPSGWAWLLVRRLSRLRPAAARS